MEYREFTDIVLAKLGNVNWGMLGRLSKQYTLPFILSCIEKGTPYIQKRKPAHRITYLSVICRKYATPADMINNNNIDWSIFDNKKIHT